MLADVFGVDGVIVLIVVVVLLFGGAAIPKLARNLGSAKNECEKRLEDGKKASARRASPFLARWRRPMSPPQTTPIPGADHSPVRWWALASAATAPFLLV